MLMTGAILSGVPRMQLKVWEDGGEGREEKSERDRGVKRSMKEFENEADV